MAKFHKYVDNEKETSYIFHCPGCGYAHGVRARGDYSWTVTGIEEDRPTVSPSVLATGQIRCHSFIKDGNIQFLSDSEHALAGQTVELPDFHY